MRISAYLPALLLLLTGFSAFGEDGEGDKATLLNYRLQPADVVRIIVFQEPDLEREVRLSQDGNVILPLIGRINLLRKTVEDAESLITELYDRDFLVNPQINITVLKYAERRVNVLGSVNNPGIVSFPPEENMNLVDAISRAGGFTRLANRRAVVLTRTEANGDIIRRTINVEDIIEGETREQWPLQINDVIYIPERRI